MARCKSCNAEIVWRETAAGRMTPDNSDGTSHWATCPQRREWRKEAPKQTSFIDDTEAPRPRPYYDDGR